MTRTLDMIDRIMKYEQGDMSQGDMVEFFQDIIDDGSVWLLQGNYGRTAQQLIEQGLCRAPARETLNDYPETYNAKGQASS